MPIGCDFGKSMNVGENVLLNGENTIKCEEKFVLYLKNRTTGFDRPKHVKIYNGTTRVAADRFINFFH